MTQSQSLFGIAALLGTVLVLSIWTFRLKNAVVAIPREPPPVQQTTVIPQPARQNAQPPRPTPPANPSREQERLQDLNRSLALIAADNTSQELAQSRTNELNREMMNVQREIEILRRQEQVLQFNAESYNRTQSYDFLRRQSELQAELIRIGQARINTQQQIENLEVQPNATPETRQAVTNLNNYLETLSASVEQIESQIAALQTSAEMTDLNVAQQRDNERAALRAELASLQIQLSDLQTDLAYWRSRQSAQFDSAQRNARMEQLQREIRQQQQRVRQ